MYRIIFNDSVHGMTTEMFDTFDSAAEYWNEYADTETCESGILCDLSNDEIIWEF